MEKIDRAVEQAREAATEAFDALRVVEGAVEREGASEHAQGLAGTVDEFAAVALAQAQDAAAALGVSTYGLDDFNAACEVFDAWNHAARAAIYAAKARRMASEDEVVGNSADALVCPDPACANT